MSAEVAETTMTQTVKPVENATSKVEQNATTVQSTPAEQKRIELIDKLKNERNNSEYIAQLAKTVIAEAAQKAETENPDKNNVKNKVDSVKSKLEIDLMSKPQTQSLVSTLKYEIASIQKPQGSEYSFIPQVTKKIVDKIQFKDITDLNAPLVYTILDYSHSKNKSLDNEYSLCEAAKKILELKDLDEVMAKKITVELREELVKKCKESNSTESKDIIKQIDTFLGLGRELHQMTPDDIKKEMNQFKVLSSKLRRYTQFISPNRSDVEREVLSNNPNATNSEITAAFDVKAKHLQEQVMLAHNMMEGEVGRDPQNRDQAAERFYGNLQKLQAQGHLSSEHLNKIYETTEEMLEMMVRNEREFNSSKRGQLASELTFRGSLSLSIEQQKLCQALEDSNLLINLIDDPSSQYLKSGKRDEVNWKKFYGDVVDILDKLLQVADGRPNEWFTETWNPMGEGSAYNKLIKTLENLATEISANPAFAKYKPISVAALRADSDSNMFEKHNTKDIGKIQTYRYGTVEKSIDKAIRQELVTDLISRRSLTEFLHNVQKICDEGLGFEQMAQYAERLHIGDVDWLIQKDPDIAYAYQLYIASLKQDIALSGGVITSKFGLKGNRQLDDIQQQALIQALASVDKSGMSSEEISQLHEKWTRKIRIATGLAQGVTAEFWGILLHTQPLISFSRESSKKHKRDKNGRPMYELVEEKDKNGRVIGKKKEPVYEEDVHYKNRNIYSGGQSGGYERMLTAIDWAKSIVRWGIPNKLPDIAFVPLPRDLAHPPTDKYEHGIIYKLADEIMDANWNGCSDWLIKQDKKYKTAGEAFQIDLVDMVMRGGWRFENIRALMRHKKIDTNGIETKTLDYAKSFKNVQALGSFGVRLFVENGDLIKQMSKADLASEKIPLLHDEHGKLVSTGRYVEKVDKHTMTSIKMHYYQKHIFQQMFDRNPTQMLGLENRRWTPAGEKTIREDLTESLQKLTKGKDFAANWDNDFIADHGVKVFVSALSFLEKSVWQEVRNKYKANPDDPTIKFDYKFDETTILANKEKLINYLALAKGSFPSAAKEGIVMDFNGLTDEHFIQMVVDVHKTMKSSIDKDRYDMVDHHHKKEHKITLDERYSGFLLNKMAGMHYLVGGEDFDMSQFILQGGGKRGHSRPMGETVVAEKSIVPGMMKFITQTIPAFAGSYKKIHNYTEMRAVLDETFGKAVTETAVPVMQVDEGVANKITVNMEIMFARTVGVDDRYRGSAGQLIADYDKRIGGAYQTYYDDMYQPDLESETAKLKDFNDFNDLSKAGRKAGQLPKDHKRPIGVEPIKGLRGTFLRAIGGSGNRTVYDDHAFEVSAKEFKKAIGLDKPLKKFTEVYAGMWALTLLAVLVMLAYLANKKNQGK